MTLTIEEAVASLIKTTDIVGGRVWKNDVVPENPTWPYVTFLGPVSLVASLEGDGKAQAYRRMVQVDLWQKERDEDSTLLTALTRALDGAALPAADQRAWWVRLFDVQRIDDERPNIVHHALTVRINHER